MKGAYGVGLSCVGLSIRHDAAVNAIEHVRDNIASSQIKRFLIRLWPKDARECELCLILVLWAWDIYFSLFFI